MTVLMMLLMIEYGGVFTDEVDGGRGTRFVGLPFPQVEVRCTMYTLHSPVGEVQCTHPAVDLHITAAMLIKHGYNRVGTLQW